MGSGAPVGSGAAEAVPAMSVPRGLVVPPVPAAWSACAWCHGPARPEFGVCFCCARLRRELGTLAPVVAVGACVVPGPFHTVLRGYKDDPDPQVRRRFTGLLSAVLRASVAGRRAEWEALAGGPPDVVVPVPPVRRPPPSPLLDVLSSRRADPGTPGVLGPAPVVEALRVTGRREGGTAPGQRIPGQRIPGQRVPGQRMHRASVVLSDPGAVRGRRVLLIDDSMTTGSSAQGAAAALRGGGAGAVVILVLGRVVRPSSSRVHAGYWEEVTAPFRTGRREPAPQPAAAAPGGANW